MRHSLIRILRQGNTFLHTSLNMGRRKRQRQRHNPLPYTNERNYTQTTKDNELFRKYYAGLGVMPENEVQAFYDQMKEPLPITFRITGYKGQARELLRLLRTKFDKLVGGSAAETDGSISLTATDDSKNPAPSSTEPSVASTTGVPGGEGDADGASKGSEENAQAVEVEGEMGDAGVREISREAVRPKCLTWYPDELAWQIDASRKDVRSRDMLSKLHELLVSETDCGNISRQEAVSMIPPLVLDVQPNSKVLDMCAAPGSKTVQLIEYLHKDENTVPEGFVVANDKENSRCYLMVHQVKRLTSPSYLIVNHDASIFPKLHCPSDGDEPQTLMFDRILADVPCSGDGTMRKNIDIWKKWNPTMGNSLHPIQLKILKRGLELLEVGGRLVYSTCSMQPVEDEAVIAEALRQCKGSVKLVDISSHFPGFKTVPGLSKWKLMNRTGNYLDDFESVPGVFRSSFLRSMFPPTPEEAEQFNLHLCHRILPHHQNTGGFFVAALQKVDHLPWSKEARLEREKANKAAAASGENSSVAEAVIPDTRKRKGQTEEGPQPKKMELKGYKEDPFLFLEPGDPVYDPIKKFYGLTDDFPVQQLLYRSETGPKRALYFVSKAVQQIVSCNTGRVRFINMGVKFVSRSPSPVVPDCEFRITHDCLGSLGKEFTRRMVPITKEDAIIIFKEENPFTNKMCEATQKALDDMTPGSVVFVYKPPDSDSEPACDIVFCGWRGKCSVRSFVPRYVRSHCLRLLGLDLAQIQREVLADVSETMNNLPASYVLWRQKNEEAEVAKMKAERQAAQALASSTAAEEELVEVESEEETATAAGDETAGNDEGGEVPENGEKEQGTE